MENGQEVTATKPNIDKFVDDLIMDAVELRVVLRDEGNKNDIKERITCLKYLNDVVKTYFILKKASTHDPSAAGSTVRKYASAFAKNATGGGTSGRRGRKPATAAFAESLDLDSDGDAA